VAVEAFLDGRLPWLAIAQVVEESLGLWPGTKATDVDVVLEVDAAARRQAHAVVERRARAA
jgi:1-deoxy-D-xylulose-5-phosphate reductoisomerase